MEEKIKEAITNHQLSCPIKTEILLTQKDVSQIKSKIDHVDSKIDKLDSKIGKFVESADKKYARKEDVVSLKSIVSKWQGIALGALLTLATALLLKLI